MSTQTKAAIFASGSGSNMQAIIDDTKIKCDIVLLVCDQPGARVIQRAEQHGLESFVCSPKSMESKEAYEQAVIHELNKRGVEWIFLAGYMRLIGPDLLEAFKGKIINIHPSLLPSFKGLHAIEQAMEAGVKVTGVTIHYVDEGMDTGPIIAQEAVSIEPLDTIEDVKEKIHQVEHRLYPQTIQQLIG